ncbi:MAG: TonB-dependent receptor [Cytophagales bacterium]|nr:TonB-dependent receptor [Bernardetiaceae bacterium]MDW8204525.1 TonB-dependent receptor [Cytophagales bacterium]
MNMKTNSLLTMALAMLLMFFAGASYAQNRTVKGKVVSDEDGSPLPGVNVTLKGTNTGTITDVEGNFSLTVSGDNPVLVFSYVGFLTQEVSAAGKDNIDIRLVVDVKALSEVVVVGYGEQKKRDVTGSMTSVKAKDFNPGAIVSPEQLMQGRAPGVVITSANGDPGANPTVRIRGGTSINASNLPLYVIDGVPIDNGTVTPGGANLGAAPPRNPLNSLNPNDIESIDILKDASAAAIYGSRGANGVIIITTKKGKEGRGTLNYDTYVGINTPSKYLPLLNAAEYRQFVQANRLNNDLGNANTDWQREVLRTAIVHSHDLSFGGGTAKTQYRASVNYFHQDGMVINSGMTRVAGRINVNHKAINDKLSLELQLMGSQVNDQLVPYSATGGFEGGLFTNVMKMNPTFPVRKPDGSFFEYPSPSIRNPVALATQLSDNVVTNRIFANLGATYEIVEGLKARVAISTDRNLSTRKVYVPRANPAGLPFGGEAAIRQNDFGFERFETYLNYQKNLFENHNLNLLAGYDYQIFTREGFGAAGRDFITDAFGPHNLGAGNSNVLAGIPPFSFKENNKLISFYARANYDIAGKYLFTATFRRDGSSRFGANNKWGNFPSASVAWRLVEENFMKGIDAITDLKLRVSYGITGSQEIGNYRSLTIFNADPGLRAVIGGIPQTGVALTQNPNPNLKWEETSQLNVGVDYGFLNNRLTGSIDYFIKRTTDLLLEFAVPQPAVVPTILGNAGEVQNKGLEFLANYTAVDKGDFRWDISANFAYIENKVVSLAGSADSIFRAPASGAGQSGVNTQVIAPGLPANSWYGPVLLRIENGVQILGPRQVLGNPNPRFTYGINNSFRYKRFDFSFFLQGVQGMDVFNNTALEYTVKNNVFTNINMLREALTDGTNLQETPKFSSRWIEDGSFLRLQNASIAYNFDISNIKWLSSLRVYATGQNLFLITKYSGLDPEVAAAFPGYDYANYPRARTFMLGLNVGF